MNDYIHDLARAMAVMDGLGSEFDGNIDGRCDGYISEAQEVLETSGIMTALSRSVHLAPTIDEVMARPMPTHTLSAENVPQDVIFVGDARAFDPWDAFPTMYGSYDERFDLCAIKVLKELQSGVWGLRDDLAEEMFKEILCAMDLCQYGSSPRTCFPTPEFEKQLPKLIEMWEQYSRIRWHSSE